LNALLDQYPTIAGLDCYIRAVLKTLPKSHLVLNPATLKIGNSSKVKRVMLELGYIYDDEKDEYVHMIRGEVA